jgi:hypothetical protein
VSEVNPFRIEIEGPDSDLNKLSHSEMSSNSSDMQDQSTYDEMVDLSFQTNLFPKSKAFYLENA